MSTDNEIILRARDAFDEYDAAKDALRVAEARINTLCREYSLAMKMWGFAPYMLRNDVEAQLGKKRA